MIVDNRAGAGGVVGAELVANAPKDGYTLLVDSLAHAINPWLYKLPYDPIKGSPRSRCRLRAERSRGQSRASGPISQGADRARPAKPGQLQYASAGVGSFTHLGGELFKLAAGVNLLHVPFRGGGPAMIDVVAGHTKVRSPACSRHAAYPLGQAARARRGRQPSASPRCRTFRPSPKPGCPVTKRSIGGASWHPPARRRPSSRSCTRRSPPCRTPPRCRSVRR